MAKTPKSKTNFSDDLKKIPRQRESPNLSSKPSWRLKQLQLLEPFGWHKLDRDKLIEVQSKLAEFESMTWSEILGRNSHFIPRTQLCQTAQDHLADLKLDDIDALVSLRLSGPERIFGILELGTLRLIFWDPDHHICPAPKKHT